VLVCADRLKERQNAAMRNRSFLLITSLLVSATTAWAGCSGPPTPSKPPERAATTATTGAESAAATQPASPLERGRALTARFYERKTAELWPQLGPKMREVLGTEQKFAAFRHQVDAELGAETKVIDETVSDTPPYRVYIRTASFSKTPQPVIVQWAFDEGGTVAGFIIQPKPVVLEGDAARDVITQGQAVTALFFQGKTAELWERMNAEMQTALGSAEKFAATYKQAEDTLGTETTRLDEKVAETPPYRVYVRTASFSKTASPVILQWAFDAEGKIAGFFIRPVH
jgi:hypothetical protein